IGAPDDFVDVGGPVGAAWLFRRSAGVWHQAGSKFAPSSSLGALVAAKVAVSADGRTALVGSPGASSNRGEVWTLDLSGSSWTQVGSALRQGDNAPSSSNFGYALALSADGTRAVIGVPGQ